MKNQTGKEAFDRLAKEYRSLGLSESEARLAARVEYAVKDVEESSRSLSLAAKSIGITSDGAKSLCHSTGIACT
jgi:hypothetical protein